MGTLHAGHRLRRNRLCTCRTHCQLREQLLRRHTWWFSLVSVNPWCVLLNLLVSCLEQVATDVWLHTAFISPPSFFPRNWETSRETDPYMGMTDQQIWAYILSLVQEHVPWPARWQNAKQAGLDPDLALATIGRCLQVSMTTLCYGKCMLICCCLDTNACWHHKLPEDTVLESIIGNDLDWYSMLRKELAINGS